MLPQSTSFRGTWDQSLLVDRTKPKKWFKLLEQRLPIPKSYQQPDIIHLITEFHDEPMVKEARRMQQAGAILSLEPIIDYMEWQNRYEMLKLIRQVDIVSPDWPSASGIAGTQNPKKVLQVWSTMGPQMVTIRHGRHGSYAWDNKNNEFWHIPAVPVDVVDPTGAGNSYSAGACIGWSQHENARVAGTYGAISAKFLVERIGVPKMTIALQEKAAQLLPKTLLNSTKL